jgi:hypothetical protein
VKLIEHIVEPKRLLLSWQPPSPGNRGRSIVAEVRRTGDDAELVYLRDAEDYRRAKEKGFSGEYPGFPGDRDHQGVLAAFLRRIPPRNRTDFGKFLDAIRIPQSAKVSDFALLGYAGAKLPSDDFTIIHPFEDAAPPFEFLLLVAGYRYYTKDVPMGKVKLGMAARFEPEPTNPHDPGAIRIVIPAVSDARAGHVSRGLLPQVRAWLLKGWSVTATVERINGIQEHPLLYLYVQVRLP